MPFFQKIVSFICYFISILERVHPFFSVIYFLI